MARLVFFNDPHFSRHAPEARADSYAFEILSKLHEVARVAIKVKASAIGCSGDWFHRKGRVTFKEANEMIAVLRTWRDKGLDVVGILGNHDIAGHSLDSLDTRAVGSLVRSLVLQLLDHEPYRVSDDDGALYVTGTSYFHGCDSDDDSRVRMYGHTVPWKRNSTKTAPHPVHVHVAHGTLVQRGDFFEDHSVARDLVDLLVDRGVCPDVIVCGHLHYPEGVKLYKRSDGGCTAVCRIGSLARVSRDDFDRRPQVLLVVSQSGRFLCKPVSVGEDVRTTPTEEHPRDPSRREERIKEFVRVLREEADDWSLVDHRTLLERVAEEMGYDETVLETAVKAVERRQ